MLSKIWMTTSIYTRGLLPPIERWRRISVPPRFNLNPSNPFHPSAQEEVEQKTKKPSCVDCKTRNAARFVSTTTRLLFSCLADIYVRANSAVAPSDNVRSAGRKSTRLTKLMLREHVSV